MLTGELGSKDVAAIARISYRQLDYWIRTGVVPKPLSPATGKGSERRFGFLDIVRVRIVAELRRDGVSLQGIRQALEILEQEWEVHDPLECGRLLAIDGRVCLETDPDTLWDLLARQSMARRIVTMDVGELVRDTQRRVRELVAA